MKIKRFVNYNKWTLFTSMLAHDLKRLGIDGFNEKYKDSKYMGIYKAYLEGYIEYINNRKSGKIIQCNELPKKVVLEPYVYHEYFKYKDKAALENALKKAIPEFLNRGILLTEVQVAVGSNQTENKMRMTLEEMKLQYPNRWIGIKDIIYRDADSREIESAEVVFTDKNASELALMAMEGEDVMPFFTTPNNVYPFV